MVMFTAAAYVVNYLTIIHFLRRVLLVLPVVALVVAFLHWRTRRRETTYVIPIALIAYVVWCIVSYGWSADPHDTAHQALEYIGVGLTGLIAGLVLDRRDLIRSFSLGSKALILIMLASLLVAYHSSTTPPAIDPAPGWHGPLGGKNGLGLLMAVALMTLWCERPQRRRASWWLLAAVVLLIGSRSGAGLCVTLVAAAILLWRQALRGVTTSVNRVVFKVGSLVMIAGGALFLVTDFPAATGLLGKNATLTGRTRIWSTVVDAIPHHIYIGVGYGGVWFNKTGATAALWKGIGFQAYEAHDSYLDLLLQLGIVGAALMVLTIGGALYRLLPDLSSRDLALVWAPLVLIGLLVEGVVESDLLSGDILLLGAVVACSLQGRESFLRGRHRSSGRPGRHVPWTERLVRVLPAGAVRDAGWSGIQQVATVVSLAFMFLVLARDLGPTRFGYYAALAGVTGLISAVVNGWAGLVITERVVREGDPPGETFASVASWLGIGAVLSVVVVSSVGHQLVPQIPVTTTVIYVASSVVGYSALTLGAATIQAVHGYGESTKGPLIQQLSLFGLLVVLWTSHDITLVTVGLCMLATNLVAGAWCLRQASRTCDVALRFGRPQGSDIRRGVVYAASLLSFAVEEDVDKPLLVRFGFARAAGVYSAAYNIVTMGLVPLNTITYATHNRFLVHDPDALGQHLRRSIRMTVAAGAYGIVAGVAAWLGAPLVPLILGSSYNGTPQMIRWLSALILLRTLTIYPFNGLMGLGRRGWRLFVLAVSAAANIGLNAALIPSLSWKGAVLATGAGEVTSMVLSWYGLVRYQRLHDEEVLARIAGQDAFSV
jgi:O-antigen/teichoic acid export membrane protein/O-antigen ligase